MQSYFWGKLFYALSVWPSLNRCECYSKPLKWPYSVSNNTRILADRLNSFHTDLFYLLLGLYT